MTGVQTCALPISLISDHLEYDDAWSAMRCHLWANFGDYAQPSERNSKYPDRPRHFNIVVRGVEKQGAFYIIKQTTDKEGYL